MLADALPYSSPEWSFSDHGLVTSQYGAYFTFQTVSAGTLTLTFSQHYPKLVFTLTIDGGLGEELPVFDQQLSLHLAAGHQYRLTLNQWSTGQIDFWQQGLWLVDWQWDGLTRLQTSVLDDSRPYLTFVGDSIVAGESMAGANHDQHQPATAFPALVAKHFHRPLNCIAYGGTGLTAHSPFQAPRAIEALWFVGPEINRHRVPTDQVIVSYGLNDSNYGATDQEFSFGLRVYLLELVKRFHGAHFYFLIPWNGAFVDIILAETSRFSHFQVVRSDQWGIVTRPNHPDQLAHQKIAKKLIEIMEE